MNSYYNLFVATENGLLKGVNSHSKTFNNLNNLDNLDKNKEIVCMCWTNDLKQDEICFATRDHHLVKYKTDHSISAPFYDLGELDVGKGVIKGIEFLTETRFVTVVESGSLKVWNINKDPNNNSVVSLEFELNGGIHVSCLKASRFNKPDGKALVATGGKENELRVFDLNNLSENKEPLFKAKNLPDNWVLLREPVWVMCIDFLDENRIVIGTAYNQIRVYDLSTGVRRPIVNMFFGKDPIIKSDYPISSIVTLDDNSNCVIAANTRGVMEMFDVKTQPNNESSSRSLKKYKGFQGTIKSMSVQNLTLTSVLKNKKTITQETKCIASCGLDRYIRVHNLKTSEIISRIYLKSRLNCLLFSRHEPIKSANVKPKDDDELSNINSEDIGTDDLWSDIEQIVEDHPNLKRKAEKRLEEFESEVSENENQPDAMQPEFKIPKMPNAVYKK